MSILDKFATSAEIVDNQVVVHLNDGQVINVPFSKFAFLAHATDEQLHNLQIEPHGFAIYWPALDDGFEIAHIIQE
jgi:hypothetical protein